MLDYCRITKILDNRWPWIWDFETYHRWQWIRGAGAALRALPTRSSCTASGSRRRGGLGLGRWPTCRRATCSVVSQRVATIRNSNISYSYKAGHRAGSRGRSNQIPKGALPNATHLLTAWYSWSLKAEAMNSFIAPSLLDRIAVVGSVFPCQEINWL